MGSKVHSVVGYGLCLWLEHPPNKCLHNTKPWNLRSIHFEGDHLLSIDTFSISWKTARLFSQWHVISTRKNCLRIYTSSSILQCFWEKYLMVMSDYKLLYMNRINAPSKIKNAWYYNKKAWLLNVLFLIRIIYLTLIPFISYASCRGYLSLLLLLPGKNSAGPSQIGTLVT